MIVEHSYTLNFEIILQPDLVQSQMLSAQKSRINTLNNELVELQNKLDELVKENRLLKKVQHRQVRVWL